MHSSMKRFALLTVLTLGAGAFALPAHALAAPQDQEHHDQDHHNEYRPEYAHNRYYRLGNQEGLQDHRRNNQRPEHTHAYKGDMDRQAHDYGYQQGWQGQSYRNRHTDH